MFLFPMVFVFVGVLILVMELYKNVFKVLAVALKIFEVIFFV